MKEEISKGGKLEKTDGGKSSHDERGPPMLTEAVQRRRGQKKNRNATGGRGKVSRGSSVALSRWGGGPVWGEESKGEESFSRQGLQGGACRKR